MISLEDTNFVVTLYMSDSITADPGVLVAYGTDYPVPFPTTEAFQIPVLEYRYLIFEYSDPDEAFSGELGTSCTDTSTCVRPYIIAVNCYYARDVLQYQISDGKWDYSTSFSSTYYNPGASFITLNPTVTNNQCIASAAGSNTLSVTYDFDSTRYVSVNSVFIFTYGDSNSGTITSLTVTDDSGACTTNDLGVQYDPGDTSQAFPYQ